MKAVQIREFVSTYDSLQPSTIPTPSPEAHEALVHIHAAGVNFVDTLYARGKHQNNRTLVRPPFTLGLEFAGTIQSAPRGSPFQRGDRVFGSGPGAYAEQICVPVASLHAVPGSWSFADAAGLGATLPVSYGALVTRGRIRRGETVLVLGAAGGLGCMAVQVAVAMGCRVIGVAGGERKCRVVKGCGAVECVDYGAEKEWWKTVLGLTENKGVDVVFDPVGLVQESLRCLAHGGRVLVVGFAGRDESNLESIAMNRVLLKQATLIGYRYGESLRRDPEENAGIWAELALLIEGGKIKPVLYDQRYQSLSAVPRALKDISSRKVWGKAVVQVDATPEEPKAKI